LPRALMCRLRNIDMTQSAGAFRMTWAELATENAFLILSILSGTGAAAVLLHAIVRSKLHNVSHADPTLALQLQQPSVLDRITLLNRNLIQCSRCFMIEFRSARFCTRCGTPMQSPSGLLGSNMPSVETRYLEDGPNRLFGLSMKLDPKTRVGVIIGIQSQETPERVNESQNRISRYAEPNPAQKKRS